MGDREEAGTGAGAGAGGGGPLPGDGAPEERRRPAPGPGPDDFSRTEVRAGIFVLVVAVILGFFYFFGKDVVTLLQEHKRIVVFFGDVSGLEEGAAVRYAGLSVGKVAGIRIVEGRTHRIEVDLRVLGDVPLRQGTVASIRATELVIGKYVDLSGGDPGAPLLQDGAEVPGSQEPTLDEVINSAGGIILNLRDIVNQVSAIFREQSMDALMANLNRMAELAAGEDRGILVSLRDSLARLDEAGFVEGLIDSSRMLRSHERQIGALLDSLSRLSGAFAGDAVPLARNLAAMSESAVAVSRDLPGLIDETRGILAKLDLTLASLNKVLARAENITEQDIRKFVQQEGMRIYFTRGQAPRLEIEPEPAAGAAPPP